MADAPPQIVETQHVQDSARILELEERIRQDYSRYMKYVEHTKGNVSELRTSIQQCQDQGKRISQLETSIQSYKDQEKHARKTGWYSDKKLISENARLVRYTVEHIQHINQLYERSGLVPTLDRQSLMKCGYPSSPDTHVKPSDHHTKQHALSQLRRRTEDLILTHRIRMIRDEQFNEILEAIVKIISTEKTKEGEMREALVKILDTPPFTFRYSRKRAREE